MNDFCTCQDWQALKNNNNNLFQIDPAYGWVLHWLELTEECLYTQVHRYGIPIRFCPFCGKKLNFSGKCE